MITTGTVMQTPIDDMRERISIVRKTISRDEMGNLVKSSDTEVLSCYAKVLPISSKTATAQEETAHEVTYRIIIRYQAAEKISGVRLTDIIKWRGKRLKLVNPPYDAESRRVWLVLECKEMVEDGAA